MATPGKTAKRNTIELDPSAIVIINAGITIFKLIIKFLYKLLSTLVFLIQRARGKTVSVVDAEIKENSAKSAKIEHVKLHDEKCFLNYGSLRWVSSQTPEAIRQANRRTNPQALKISIKYILNNELNNLEIDVFGAHSETQAHNIEFALQNVIENKKRTPINLKEVHIVKELGTFLDISGTVGSHVPGFTIDNSGACLMTEDLSFNPNWCASYFYYLINDDHNYQDIRAKAQEALWNQNSIVKERIKNMRDYRAPDTRYPSGTLRGRHIIDLDCAILRGILLSPNGKEALYADNESECLSAIYNKLLQEIRRIKAPLGIELEEHILAVAMKHAQCAFPRSTEEALRNLRTATRACSDEEVALDIFVKAEIGDIEHKVLLLGYLLDRLCCDQSHYLQGRVSIDRNWLPGGGHIWIRYAHSPQDIYIVDPLKSFCGRLDNYASSRWPYERREDLIKARVSRPID